MEDDIDVYDGHPGIRHVGYSVLQERGLEDNTESYSATKLVAGNRAAEERRQCDLEETEIISIWWVIDGMKRPACPSRGPTKAGQSYVLLCAAAQDWSSSARREQGLMQANIERRVREGEIILLWDATAP